jgi:hypothetical protein
MVEYGSALAEFTQALDIISVRLREGSMPTEAELLREQTAGTTLEFARRAVWDVVAARSLANRS